MSSRNANWLTKLRYGLLVQKLVHSKKRLCIQIEALAVAVDNAIVACLNDPNSNPKHVARLLHQRIDQSRTNLLLQYRFSLRDIDRQLRDIENSTTVKPTRWRGNRIYEDAMEQINGIDAAIDKRFS